MLWIVAIYLTESCFKLHSIIYFVVKECYIYIYIYSYVVSVEHFPCSNESQFEKWWQDRKQNPVRVIWDEVPTMVEIAIFWFHIHITNGLNSLHRKWHTGNQYMVKSAENRMRSNLEGCRTFRNLVVSYLDRDVSYQGKNV
jgi:hypothetical protein